MGGKDGWAGHHVTGCQPITQEIRQSENGKAGALRSWTGKSGHE